MGKQIIEHSQLGIGVETWLEELTSLCEETGRWCQQQADRVRACYAVPSGSKVTLFFVPCSDSYDFDLGAELVDLNSSLVRKYNVGMVETLQIPWDERERFIREDTLRPVYGDASSAHRTVAT